MIKLTNASEGFSGKVIYLNPSHIVSMYSEDNATQIYGGLTGSTVIWTVMESMEEVIDLIDGGVEAHRKEEEALLDAPYGTFNNKPIETEEEMMAIIKSSNL